jgi:hypothetical protein
MLNDLLINENPFFFNPSQRQDSKSEVNDTNSKSTHIFTETINSINEIDKKPPSIDFKNTGSFISDQKTHHFSSLVFEFVSKALIEKTFFQNTTLPQETILYLVNDLIHTLNPQKKQMFSVSTEITIIYKWLMGQPLTKEEEKYNRADKELDVFGEILNGLRYSSLFLLGRNLYSSIASIFNQGLWSHLPSMAAYTSAIILGPQAVRAAVDNVLIYASLTTEQKNCLRPWLNTVGRLALGFTPKVHATEAGVHYRYPYQKGHTEIYSDQGKVIIEDDVVKMTKPATLTTSEKTHDAEYVEQFKLNQISRISDKSLLIRVVNDAGQKVQVEFRLNAGQDGPKIIVKSADSKLEAYWSNYFHQGHQKPVTLQSSPIQQDTSSPLFSEQQAFFPFNLGKIFENTNFYAISASYVIASLMKGGSVKHSSPLTSTVVALTTLSLSNSVKADWWNPVSWFTKKPIERAINNARHQALVTINEANGIVREAIGRVETLEGKMVVDVKDVGNFLIEKSGNAVVLSSKEIVKDIADKTELILKIAGFKSKKVIIEGGKVVKTLMEIGGDQIKLIIKEGREALSGVFERDIDNLGKLSVNFGEQGRLTIQELGNTLTYVADETLNKFFIKTTNLVSSTAEQIRINIDRFRDGVRLSTEELILGTKEILNEGEKKTITILKHLPKTGRDTAYDTVYNTGLAVKHSFFGQSEFNIVFEKIKNNCVDTLRENNNILTKTDELLTYIFNQKQDTLSSSNKALLYVELLKQCVNDPLISASDQNLLYFLVASQAFKDEKLGNDYFKSGVIPSVPQNIKNAFLKRNFNLIANRNIKLIEMKYPKTFSTKTLEAIRRLKTDEVDFISSDAGNPVGTLIAFASSKLPGGYLRCDGKFHAIDDYPELYEAVRDYAKLSEDRKSFNLPDLSGRVLRNVGEGLTIGQLYDDTTRLPTEKPFEIVGDGEHVHTTESDGPHIHEITVNGDHIHTLTKEGEHTHSSSSNGKHSHDIQTSGKHSHGVQEGGQHTHGMDGCGDHNHINGEFNILLKKNRQFTVGNWDHIGDEPNVIESAPLLPNGNHVHHIHDNGGHSHGLDENGEHKHGITTVEDHIHVIDSVPSHNHTVSMEGLHKHEMRFGGNHTHTIMRSGNHTHQISGGDTETMPKNMVVAYLIKAKPTPNYSEKIKDLESKITTLENTINNSPNQLTQMITMVGVTAGTIFILKRLKLI